MKIPSDYKILSMIYKNHYHEFLNYSEGDSSRSSKVYVPIDIQSIANELNVDGDIVFGRLYYHLEEKYSYQKSDDSWVHLFITKLPTGERHLINYPLMSSVLSGLKEERSKTMWSLIFSSCALAISLITLIFNMSKTIIPNQCLSKLEQQQEPKVKSIIVQDQSPKAGSE